MYKIPKKDFTKFKADLRNWLDIAFEEGIERRYYENGTLWKVANQEFFYEVNIEIGISAACHPDTGDIIKPYFDDLEIIDIDGNEYKRSQIDPDQTDEINQILKEEL